MFIDSSHEPSLIWRKSRESEKENECVEVAFSSRLVYMRDSRDPGGPTLSFTHLEWEVFLCAVKSNLLGTQPIPE
ncbi:DUF397 domain-containing protein [Streptosporangium sp. NPDC023615]|uniref:DUF397 domain-containing protein n=1 Tax=Streptosporangium sp. NPDC023615 TaxID=3154794 RepID=UPI003444F705